MPIHGSLWVNALEHSLNLLYYQHAILKKDWCIHAPGETYLFHLDFKEVLTRYRFYTLYSHKQEKHCHKMSHCLGFKNKPADLANGLKYYLGRFPNRDLVLRALRATVTQTLLF